MDFDEAAVSEVSALGAAWAGTSINATSFRRSAVASGTYGGVGFDATAYYDADGEVILARRQVGSSEWTLTGTGLTGNIDDAHNVIALGVDGQGTVHLAWDMHGGRLKYATMVGGGRSAPVMSPMLGDDENKVTYPEFYPRSDGGLYFLYRNGASGDGDLVLNMFDAGTGTWRRLSSSLISGEGQRSAYWQAVVDSPDRLHLTWTWRDTSDVSSNHDIMYAVSTDGSGLEWTDSQGTELSLPITASTAEVAVEVPEGSNLINQTGMALDDADSPYVATYWQADRITQYRVVALDPDTAAWTVTDTGIRSTTFDLSGTGTRALPLARPDIAVSGAGDTAVVHLLLRDDERSGAFTIATGAAGGSEWTLRDITADTDLGWWEPTYDRTAWKRDRTLQVYVQRMVQTDGDSGALERSAPGYLVTVDPRTVG